MTIDKQRIRDIPLDDGLILVDVHFRNVINNINSSATGKIAGFDDPQVLRAIHVTIWVLTFHLVLFEHLHEISVLVWEHKGFRYKIPWLKTVLVLHLTNINTQPIFSCNFITLRKMIYLLVLI